MTLRISKLSIRQNDKWILKDAAFESERGEIFGVVGENNSGKSTLLHLLDGSLTATLGEIFHDGTNVVKHSKEKRGFTSLPVESKTKWPGLFAKSEIPVSGSEARKASIEKALAEAESVILFDNVFSDFDRNALDEIFAMIRKTVAEKNLHAIVATSDDEVSFGLCDRIGILHDGGIVQVGTPRDVYQNPNSVASARALGRNNLITSRRVSFTNQSVFEFHTLTGEHRLRTDKVERRLLGAINQNVTLAIRPEHISISFGASFPEDNLLKAEVVGVQYLGATTRLRLNAGGLPLEALVLRLVGLNIGDECMVGLPQDRIIVLKD